MAILKILTAPHPKLKQVADPVAEVNDKVRKILDDMHQTMLDAEGCGLAATQVGIMQRMLVIDLAGSDRDPAQVKDSYPLYMINPVIIQCSENQDKLNEGCLSLPEQLIEIERSEAITIKYLDYHGKSQILEARGFKARAIQHEMDHLNGIVLLDYLSPMKRDVALRKLAKTSA